MLRHLILDIGNVICDWDPERLVSYSFTTPEDKVEALSVTVESPDWQMLDRGSLALDDAIARAVARTSLAPDAIASVYHNLGKSLTAISTTTEAMRRAHLAGVPIYVLSNMPAHAWQHLEKTYSCWDYCEGTVISSEVRAIKPEPEIFQHLCERFSVKPEHCVFVDDMKVNTDAARAAGMQSVQLTDKHAGGKLIDSLVNEITQAQHT